MKCFSNCKLSIVVVDVPTCGCVLDNVMFEGCDQEVTKLQWHKMADTVGDWQWEVGLQA
jgi:hypothetical protein